eukprot:TRINITY_DN2427_c0_g1_i1.p1 TRINITY_DN2427_c0_g1~~TRINITY_DN2427_c0_g1_i1.p1  ORF type:complete len:177 (-),score=14.43 TRINITY_DN2427_c0_g1_i1:112-642(-)
MFLSSQGTVERIDLVIFSPTEGKVLERIVFDFSLLRPASSAPTNAQHPQPSSAGAAHQAQLQARNSPAAQAGGAGNRDEEALEAMEFALRTFLVKASMAECLQQPLPEECAWELVAHSKHLPSSRSPSGQFWVPAECPDRVSASVPSLAAVKSVNTGAMKLQLYVERSNYKAYTIC